MANAAGNIKKDQFRRELATKKAEEDDAIELCGRELIEKVQKALHKIAMGSKKINNNNLEDIASANESSDFQSSQNTKERNLKAKKEIRA